MLNVLLFLLTAVFWGGSFVAIKFAINGIAPVNAAMWRVFIGVVFLLPVLFFTKRSMLLPFHIAWKVWLTGVFAIGLPFVFLFMGEQNISAGLAGIINGTVPLWTFILGIFFLKDLELFDLRSFIGLTIGFFGIVLVFSPAVSMGGSSKELWGMLSVSMMAISYAISAVMNRHLLSGKIKIEVLVNVFHQMVVGFIFLAVASLILEGWRNFIPVNANTPAIVACIYLGVFSTGIAWIIYYRLIKQWGAVKASGITYIVPMMAVFLDYIFFGQIPHTIELAGLAIILLAIIFIQLPVIKRTIFGR